MQKTSFRFVVMLSLLLLLTSCGPGNFGQVQTPVPNLQTATPAPSGQINVPAVSIQIYAPGPNPLVRTAGANGQVAGVLLGIWHGIISPVTMLLSFFYPDVQMYEVFNDGSQYNLGFLLGVVIFFVVLGALLSSRRR